MGQPNLRTCPLPNHNITTAQQLASSRHISVKKIFFILRTCNFNSKYKVRSLFCNITILFAQEAGVNMQLRESTGFI